MNSSTRFEVMETQVVHEIIDNEVVIINMTSGNYYSLTGTGAEVWQLICQGVSFEEIMDGWSRRYEADQFDIQSGLQEFLEEMQVEGIIHVCENSQKPRNQESIIASETSLREKTVFEYPKLIKFDDMKELLLLDPIHDTDKSGWPTLKKNTE